MDLPQPRDTNEFRYSSNFARSMIPRGAGQHWQRIRCAHPGQQSGEVAAINVNGKCSGEPEELIKLGIAMAQDLKKRGKVQDAKKILDAVTAYVQNMV